MTGSFIPSSPIPPTGLRLRPIRVGDGPPLRRACFPERSAAEVEQIVAAAEAGRGWFLVAEWEGEIVGSGGLVPWGRGGEIANLIVAPEFRRRGIGRALVNALLGVARSQRYATVEVGAEQGNEAALALYGGSGFVHDRTVRLELGGTERVLVYLKKCL